MGWLELGTLRDRTGGVVDPWELGPEGTWISGDLGPLDFDRRELDTWDSNPYGVLTCRNITSSVPLTPGDKKLSPGHFSPEILTYKDFNLQRFFTKEIAINT